MPTYSAKIALIEVAAKLGTVVKVADVLKHFPAHLGHVKRNSTSPSRGVFDFSTVDLGGDNIMNKVEYVPQAIESDEQIDARLRERFEALDVITQATAVGVNRAFIVSGAAGLGKSFGIEKKLEELKEMGAVNPMFVKGYVRPMSMYKLMYENRHQNSVLVFDDADSVFADDVALNLLKAACDSSDVRQISWMSEFDMRDEDGESIPRSFIFEGSIIFITNYDFTVMIDRGTRLAPHFAALISRALYLDLGLKTNRDYYVRIKQVVSETDMLINYTYEEREELMEFVETHQDAFRDFSLRMVCKLAALYRMGDNWQSLAKMTLLK